MPIPQEGLYPLWCWFYTTITGIELTTKEEADKTMQDYMDGLDGWEPEEPGKPLKLLP